MSTIEGGKRIQLTWRERGQNGRPTLIVTVSAADDILPHEHREDMQEVAAAVMGVPLAALEGVEVELRRAPHPHPPAPRKDDDDGIYEEPLKA
ncbi:MAG: hypothetical protein AAGA48_00895 [Myxococcota bacterium]